MRNDIRYLRIRIIYLKIMIHPDNKKNCCNMPLSGQNMNNISTISTVLISENRLKELEALESNLPKLIEDAIQENKKKNLRRLHEKDKNNPESVNLRVKRYAMRHKKTLNARRREKREQSKKLLAEQNSLPSSNHGSIRASPDLTADGSPIATLSSNMMIPGSPISSLYSGNVITVRFDD